MLSNWYWYLFFTLSVPSWSLPGFIQGCKGWMPCWKSCVFREVLPQQIRISCCYTTWTIHHFLFTWNGNRTMDCELRNLSVEIQKCWWRHCCCVQLVFKSDRERVIHKSHGSSCCRWHIPRIRWNFYHWPRIHLLFSPWNPRPAIWGGGEAARGWLQTTLIWRKERKIQAPSWICVKELF